LDIIDATARSALTELERLPTETSDQQRNTTDITAIVDRVRAAGTPVDLTVIGEIPPAVIGVVYRIVQESLTNVIRHSPGAHARVEINQSGGQVRVLVADSGPAADHSRLSRSDTAPTSDRGYGLVGLAERVEFAGGS